jgi:hypothetical protein
MMKKAIGILIVGLLISTLLPVGSALTRTTEEKNINTLSSSPIEITMKGGWGLQAIIKNTGTTDLTDAKITLVLDGRLIFPGYEKNDGTIDLKVGKTQWVIFPVMGFGATNIEITVDTTTATASGIVLGYIILGVK